MRLADYVSKSLAQFGVDHIFMLIGLAEQIQHMGLPNEVIFLQE